MDLLIPSADLAGVGPLPEGTFALTAAAPGYQPARLEAVVADRRPYRLAFDPTPGGVAGQEQVITLRLLDRRGRTVEGSHYGWASRITVTARQPDGTAAELPAITATDPATGRPLVEPGRRPLPPGTYTLTAQALLVDDSEVQLEAAATAQVQAP